MTQKYKVNKKLINTYSRNRKNDNIFILTRDNYYFILKKPVLLKSDFFQNLFKCDDQVGYLRKPIFLQKINSKYFKFIIQYLEEYTDKAEKKWESNKYICIHELHNLYNKWDSQFITKIKNTFQNDIEEFEELLKQIHYMGINNLYEKVKYCYDFVVNTKKYKLDDIDIDVSDSSETEEEYM